MRIKIPEHDFFGINVIPMIDTMMFLLVFFLMATKFADIERDVRVKPPDSRNARPMMAMPREMVVNVGQDGQFVIGGHVRQTEEVDRLIGLATSGNPDQAVVIRGDKRAVLQFAVNILDLCEKHNVKHTYLTTNQGDK
jgi:biopolymer transport protein ExbD